RRFGKWRRCSRTASATTPRSCWPRSRARSASVEMTPVRLALATAVVVAVLAIPRIGAVTRIDSADGQFWDVQDTSPWGQDSGGIATGGRADPFNGFGYLKLQVRRPDATLLVRNQYLAGFGLASDTTGGVGRFDSITPLLRGDVIVSRALFAPADTDYLRYFDSFTSAAGEDRLVDLAW